MLRCISGPIMEIRTSIGGELWCGQAKFWLFSLTRVNFEFSDKFDLDGLERLLHLWSKFGDPSLNRWWVIMQTRMDTHRCRQRRYLASDKNWLISVVLIVGIFLHCASAVALPGERRCTQAQPMTTSFEVSTRIAFVGLHSTRTNKMSCVQMVA